MLYPQKMLVFVCTILSGCAAGVMGDEIDPPSPRLAEQESSSAAPVVDAGTPAVPVVVSSATESPVVVPVLVVSPPTGGQDAGAPAAPAASTSPLDAALPVSTQPEASLPSVTVDAAATRDAAASATRDAASEASAPPPSAPSCNPAQCDNECFLLARCCNAQNQCACFSVLRRTCSLPSL